MDNRKILTPNDKPNLSKKQSYANAKHYYGKFNKYLLIDIFANMYRKNEHRK